MDKVDSHKQASITMEYGLSTMDYRLWTMDYQLSTMIHKKLYLCAIHEQDNNTIPKRRGYQKGTGSRYV
ncbi:hypothetical protein [Mucilaginibacter paludis]|uniref:hypothetical protein n=1 Tax=Mucilaginibacter paludis TaxID=423351 RepID=UPI001C276763|nr:hypothetical protein [Mucilaginibacter paludis]